MKKNPYTTPEVSTWDITSDEALLVTMSYEGKTVVSDGGKASENNVMNADVKGNSFSIWDDDWSY